MDVRLVQIDGRLERKRSRQREGEHTDGNGRGHIAGARHAEGHRCRIVARLGRSRGGYVEPQRARHPGHELHHPVRARQENVGPPRLAAALRVGVDRLYPNKANLLPAHRDAARRRWLRHPHRDRLLLLRLSSGLVRLVVRAGSAAVIMVGAGVPAGSGISADGELKAFSLVARQSYGDAAAGGRRSCHRWHDAESPGLRPDTRC